MLFGIRTVTIVNEALNLTDADNVTYRFNAIRLTGGSDDLLLPLPKSVTTVSGAASIDLKTNPTGAIRYLCEVISKANITLAKFVFDLVAGPTLNLRTLFDAGTGNYPQAVYVYVDDKIAGLSTLQLGETDTTAYRGDRGKIAYDHSQIVGGVHIAAGERNTWNGQAASAVATIRNGVVTAGDDLAKLYALIQTINALIGAGVTDGDALVNTVTELLTVFATYPEGTDILTALNSKINTSAIVNTLIETTSGKVLDARQGKALNDLITALTSTVAGKQAALGFTPENVANRDASGGYVGRTVWDVNFFNTGGSNKSLLSNINTSPRTYLFQDKDGTIADLADVSTAQAFAIQRANHTGTQSADTLTDGTTNKAYLATERTKLAGIATGATANQTDAYLLARANHTGFQAQSTITNLTSDLALKADLVAGLVPSSQLPSFVDDVLEYANFAALPGTGESGKIYVTQDTNLTYRWSGSAYAEISASLALGETSATAYRGDRGKAAYDHSLLTSGNPHNILVTDLVQNASYRFVTDTEKSTWNAKAGLGANTFIATQTITPAVNTNALAVTGYSLTGSNTTPMIDLAGTWNTSGTPDGLIVANLTNTASGGIAPIVNLKVGGSSMFQVLRNGTVNIAGAAQIDNSGTFIGAGFLSTGFVQAGVSSYFRISTRGKIQAASDGVFLISNDAITDFGRLQFGGTTNSFNAIGRDAVNGFTFQSAAGTATWNDASTAASGTVANRYLLGIAAPTLTATNVSVTDTVASTLYIGGAPTASTNTTIGKAYALNVAAGNSYFGGNKTVGASGTASSGTQYPSYDTIWTGSAWNTSGPAAVSCSVTARVIAGSGASGSEPYRLAFLNNGGTELGSFDGLNQYFQVKGAGTGTTKIGQWSVDNSWATLSLDGSAYNLLGNPGQNLYINRLSGKSIFFTESTFATQQMVILTGGNIGMNTATPRRRVDILDASNPQLRWSYTDNSVYGEVQANSSGNSLFTTTGSYFDFNKDIRSSGNIIANGSASTIRMKGYTVATLPSGTQGDTAFCTDLLAPGFLVAAVGGGAVVGPVFFNGSAWVAY